MAIGHVKVKHHSTRSLLQERDANCANGLYLAPDMGASVNALQPLTISWDPTCLSAALLDIYLYSPSSANPRIHVWEKVTRSAGTYNATLSPRWWNSTSSQSLQIGIVPDGQLPFMTTFPAGPVFTATYTAPASGAPANTSASDSGVTMVNDLTTHDPMIPGKKAAAIILPLLLVILGIAVYIKIKRSKGKEKRKKWSEAVDKRMSTISADWKSVSVAGANAAIRNSMAVGSRNSSSFSFGAIRHSSAYAVEGDDAGSAQMSQVRKGTGVGLRHPGTASTATAERVSRVSFAPDTRGSRTSAADFGRPSGESRRTRAYHNGAVPPVPILPTNSTYDAYGSNEKYEDEEEESPGSLSPVQTQGAVTLTPEEIRARITPSKPAPAKPAPTKPAPAKRPRIISTANSSNPDFVDLMPALSMMRTGSDLTGDELLFSSSAPTSPLPKPITTNFSQASSQPKITSPVMSAMPMQPMPANVMSPDEMLRAYADRKKTMSMISSSTKLSTGMISYPMPVASSTTTSSLASARTSSNNSMRTMYNGGNPAENVVPTPTANPSSPAATVATSVGYNSRMSQYSAAEAYTNAANTPYPAYPYTQGTPYAFQNQQQ